MRVANNVQKLRWPAKSLKFKSYRPLVGASEMQGSCTAAATKSQGAQACYSSEVGDHSTRVYIHRHILSMSIWYIAVDATPG